MPRNPYSPKWMALLLFLLLICEIATRPALADVVFGTRLAVVQLLADWQLIPVTVGIATVLAWLRTYWRAKQPGFIDKPRQ